jgi:biopolymer transport protein ExbD
MRLRRSGAPIHLDMTPLIDVVFLLLTFFIFALVLMVRADVLDIRLPRLGSGEAAPRTDALLLSLTQDGQIVLEGQTLAEAEVGERVAALLAEREGVRLILSADARAPSGRLIELADRLIAAGVREFSIAGTPAGEIPPPGPNPAPPAPEE